MNGPRSSNGRLVRTARSHILADFADTRARRKPLKPLRAGTSGDSGVLVYSCAFLPMQSAHEAAGATGTRRSPRPLRGRKIHQRLGRFASRDCERTSAIAVIASVAKQSIKPQRKNGLL